MTPAAAATLGGVALKMSTGETLHPLSVDDYNRMIDAGILTTEDRVELLDGAIVEMSPEGAPHILVSSRLAKFVIRALDDDKYEASIAGALALRPNSEPQPDVTIRPHGEATWTHKPEKALLLIEVAHTSLAKDRGRKARIYARARIPEYWIVDLKSRRVEVHTDPAGGAYTKTTIVERDGVVQAQAVDLPPLHLAELFAD